MTAPTPCPKCTSVETFYSSERHEWLCGKCTHRWTTEVAAERPPLKIFLSYGHDEHTATALRIKADLEARGHKVWFDAERLHEGRDWERYIEEGLGNCDKVVLLMTPHSVRRRNPRDPESRDGYCLNEIAKAIEKNKLIVPVMLVTLDDGPPTSICRIQYLDLRDSVPVAEHEEQYKVRLERLAKAIEKDDLDFEGGQARLARLLRPLSFDAEMSRHIATFTGRLWLLRELDAWLEGKPGSRVFWLMGGPGIGKTAVATYLAHRRPEVIGYHFCTHGHADKGDPATAVLSIAYQMAQHLPEYAKRLSNKELEREVGKNAGTLFDNLVVEPLGKDFPAPDGPRLVLIDAIDEATRDGKNAIAELIRDHWASTPPWLRLVITSRPEVEVVSTLGHLDPYTLDAQRAENLEDLERFLRQQLSARGIAFSDSLLRTILEKSEGIFLYVRVLLDEIDAKHLTLDHPDELPVGLFGHYQRFFSRQLPDVDRYQGELRPLLEVVCAGREPVPLALLSRATGASGLDVRQRLARLGSLLSVRPAASPATSDGDTVAPFHKSVRDWLTAIDPRTRLSVAGPYAIDGARGEQSLADAVAKELKADVKQASAYALRHGPSHLVAAGRVADAAELMTEFGYHYERLRRLGHNDVVNVAADFALLDAAPNLAPAVRGRFGVWKVFHAENAHRIQRHVADLAPETSLLQLAVAHAESSQVTESAERWLDAVGSGTHWLRSLRRPRAVERRACLRTVEGHTDFVCAVAFLQDNKLALSGSNDHTLRLWDLDRGQCLRTLEGHTEGVRAVAVSPNGRHALSGSWDETLKYWDIETGQCLRTFQGHKKLIHAVAISPDGRRGLSGSSDNTIKLWDISSGRCLNTLEGHIRAVKAVAVSSDGHRAISAGDDYDVKLWDIETGQCLHTFEGHANYVNAVALLPGDRRAISASSDKTIKLWDLESGQCLKTLEGHVDFVTAVAISSDGHRAVSASHDKTLKVWDLGSGRCVSTLIGHAQWVNAVAISPDGRRAISGDGTYGTARDNKLKLWNLEAGECPPMIEGHTSMVRTLAPLPGGDRAISASSDKTLKLWHLESCRCLRTLVGHAGEVTTVEVSSDGRLAFSAAANQNWSSSTLKLWDLDTGLCLRTFEGHAGVVRAVALSLDGRHAISGSRDRTLKLWDLETGQCLRTIPHTNEVQFVEFLPGGCRAFSGGNANAVKLWELASGECLSSFEGHEQTVAAFALLPDRRHFLSACKDLKLWDLESGLCLHTLKGHAGPVEVIAFTPDCSRALTGGSDKTLRHWDLRTGECLSLLEGHAESVVSAAFLPEGRHAISGSYDRTLKVWDLDTGLCLAMWQADTAISRCVATPLGILAGTFGGEVLFLKLMPPGRVAPEVKVATWHPSRPLLTVSTSSGTLLVQAWYPSSQYLEELARSAPIPGAVTSLRFSLDGTRLQILTADNTEHILDATTLQPAPAPTCAWAEPRDVSPDNAWRAVIRDGRLVVEAAKP